MSLRRYRPIAVVLVVLHLNACSTWQPATVSPRELVERDQPSSVRVTRLDGRQSVLRDPYITNDSIVGWVRIPCSSLAISGRCIGGRSLDPALLDEVTAIQVRRFSAGTTVLASVVVIGAIFGIAYAGGLFGDWGSESRPFLGR